MQLILSPPPSSLSSPKGCTLSASELLHQLKLPAPLRLAPARGAPALIYLIFSNRLGPNGVCDYT
jgi:hypothetical protein